MKPALRITLVMLLIAVSSEGINAQRSNAAITIQNDTVSGGSNTRARQIVEDGLNALGGLEAMRAAQDVKIKVRGFSYARNQSVGVDAPYDKMTRDEDLFIDLRNRRFIIETRDPLPGGFVFGGTQIINGNQGLFINP